MPPELVPIRSFTAVVSVFPDGENLRHNPFTIANCSETKNANLAPSIRLFAYAM